MKRILRWFLVSLSSVLCACVGRIDLDHLQPNQPLPFNANGYIALQGGACLGPCPDYDVFIFSDGHVIFRGNSHTLLKGTRFTRIPKARFAELLRTLDEKRFFDAQQSSGQCLTDQPAFHVTAVLNGASRRRLVDSGCLDDRDLWPTVESIPRLAGVDRWARYDNLRW